VSAPHEVLHAVVEQTYWPHDWLVVAHAPPWQT
jgi:hypothetical protein